MAKYLLTFVYMYMWLEGWRCGCFIRINMAAVSSVGRGILSQLKQSLKEWSKGKWPPQRILIARKTSRLEYERLRYSHMADSELKEMVSTYRWWSVHTQWYWQYCTCCQLAAQGSDYAGLLLRHRQHSLHVEKIILYLQWAAQCYSVLLSFPMLRVCVCMCVFTEDKVWRCWWGIRRRSVTVIYSGQSWY